MLIDKIRDKNYKNLGLTLGSHYFTKKSLSISDFIEKLQLDIINIMTDIGIGKLQNKAMEISNKIFELITYLVVSILDRYA